MKRILFVDDEVNVLHGLRRMLRSKRSEWLLKRASLIYPQMVRIALSGQANQKVSHQTVGTVHQFLWKPCNVEGQLSDWKQACIATLYEGQSDEQ